MENVITLLRSKFKKHCTLRRPDEFNKKIFKCLKLVFEQIFKEYLIESRFKVTIIFLVCDSIHGIY